MSRRVRVIPGRVYAMSRRTSHRFFLFTPNTPRIRQAFWYCLAYCADKHGIEIHAAVLMSTHIHLVFTDVRGNRPVFKQEFHRLFALCVKRIRGWSEDVFNKYSDGEHELLNANATLDAIAYLIANPASAFAVRYAKDWPGAQTSPRDLGRRVVVATKPDVFFDPQNDKWPERVELRFSLPILLDNYSPSEVRTEVSRGVRELEKDAISAARELGHRFHGQRRVLSCHHTQRAMQRERSGERKPRFASGGDVQAAQQALRELREFETAYADALIRWRSGEYDVVFPYGTWWMRVHHGVSCAPFP